MYLDKCYCVQRMNSTGTRLSEEHVALVRSDELRTRHVRENITMSRSMRSKV
jgi:hypothetical protein